MLNPERIVIVGFGAAGLTAAQTLRLSGWTGKLTILSKEDCLPYDRPPLTKQYLNGESTIEKIRLLSSDRIQSLGAEIHYGVRAERLDLVKKEIKDSNGATHRFDDLIISTGVRPRTLPGVPEAALGYHTIRTQEDADALRAELQSGTRLVVVGGGFLGLEAAATARKMGAIVTVIEPTPMPLGPKIGDSVAAKLLEVHKNHGVKVIAGTGITSVKFSDPDEPTGRPKVAGVELTNGSTVEADVVLVAVGSVPETEWLQSSGLILENGVVCDEYCRAAEGVWAAGDIANWLNLGTGARMRLEHRMNAAEQGQAAAKNILGAKQPFTPIPFFWTDHFNIRIQSVGTLGTDEQATPVENDVADDAFVLAYHDQGQLIGGLNWNAARGMMPLRKELATRGPVATWK